MSVNPDSLNADITTLADDIQAFYVDHVRDALRRIRDATPDEYKLALLGLDKAEYAFKAEIPARLRHARESVRNAEKTRAVVESTLGVSEVDTERGS